MDWDKMLSGIILDSELAEVDEYMDTVRLQAAKTHVDARLQQQRWLDTRSNREQLNDAIAELECIKKEIQDRRG